MAKAIYHAINSVNRYGGKPDDFIALHEFLDQSKDAIADNRHRILTHHMWFVKHVLQRVFGDWMVIPTTDEGLQNAARIAALQAEIDHIKETMRREKQGRVVSVAQIGEDHILEDFGGKFIPIASDYIIDGELKLRDWMNNGRSGRPSSAAMLLDHLKTRTVLLD